MRNKLTAALAGPFVALAALGAFGAYIGLRHPSSVSPRLEAVIFVAVAALGVVLGLAGASRGSSSDASSLDAFAKRAEKYASVEVPAAVEAALEALPGGCPPEVPELGGGRLLADGGFASLARSIEALAATAVGLATSQGSLRANLAEAFVNLGRRNQNLVTRQLEYISELEQNEADPDALDELFRLDHLATRMRRNAESLLVLAGASSARQWDTPVPAMDIARAACAEVEDYKRLRLHHFDPALVSGSATTDLVHILAELTENALTYSPPGSPVDIYGRFLEGGYVIVIVDAGIGMSEEDLATANRRLRGEGAESEVPGRFLGHYVAGMLACRHNVSVSLQPSQAGGLVARVKVPSDLVQEPPAELPGAATARPIGGGEPKLAELGDLVPEPAVNNFEALAAAAFAAVPPPAEPAPPEADRSVAAPPLPSRLAPVPEPPLASGPSRAEVPTPEGATSPSSRASFGATSQGRAPAEEEPPVEAFGRAWDPITALLASSSSSDGRTEGGQDDEPAAGRQAGSVPRSGEQAGAGARPADEETAAQAPEPAAAGTTAGTAALLSAPEKGAPPASPATYLPRHASPDLGYLSPLAGLTRREQPADNGGATSPVVDHEGTGRLGGPPQVPARARYEGDPGPAAQARSTADALRRLTRRVPGAALAEEDGSLRRAPAGAGLDSGSLPSALSQYLSATAADSHRNGTEHEHP